MRTILLSIIILVSSCSKSSYEWIDYSKTDGLFKIDASKKFEVFSTSPTPASIEKTIKNLEQAKAFYDEIFNENLVFVVLFIDNQNWNKYAFSPPPGMPQAYYEGVVVLGLNNSVMALQGREMFNHMPEEEMEALKESFGPELNLDLFFRDALSLHELGHLYQFYKTGKGSQRRWLSELFGNMCQIAAADSFEDKSTLNHMETYQNMVSKMSKGYKPPFNTLKQFESNYLEIIQTGSNYGWYQIQFYQTAKKLLSLKGKSILPKLREFLIESDVDNVGSLNDNEFDLLLEENFDEETLTLLHSIVK
ncbi:MAG: hypothetical protein NXI00_20410 [Cytophagales bacterium]|nr:hypothetical protein [Cytophagales bacterium]